MTAPPVAAGLIAVAPSSLGAAAAAGSALASQVAAVSLPVPADGVSNPQCFQAFSGAVQLVGEALHVSAGSLDQLARALQSAAGAYALADLVAVAPGSG